MSTGPKSKLDDAFRAAEPLDPDDRMRLIARLWESLPADYWAAPDGEERASVRGMLAGNDMRGLAGLPRRIAKRLLAVPAAPPAESIYSAPRRFDLATVFAVTSAYSLLFAVTSYVVGYLDLSPAASLFVGGFVTLVGVAQAVLFGGQNARIASVGTGVVLCVLWNLYMVIWPPRYFSGIAMIFLLPISAALGVFFGYTAGVMVGGVFLVADKIRTFLVGKAEDSEDDWVELTEIESDE
jgi:hypothetical protein